MVFVSVCFIDYFFTILVSYIEQDEAFICIYSYRYTLLIGLCIDSFIWSILFVFASVGLYVPVLYMSLLFPFMLGAMLVKYDIINKCKLWRCKSLFILLLLMVVRMYLETGVFHVLYSVAFIVLFVQIKRPVWLDTFLYEMGCRSTSMWFVHTYFCYYLFKDFIYGFKYPLLIFSVLLVVSYLFALVIDRIYQPLQQLITQKWR